jgi:hypothetical protein
MTTPIPPRGRTTGPGLAVVVLLLAVIVGGFAGVAVDRHFLLGKTFRPGWERFEGRRPPRDREFRNRFAKAVGLSPAQQVRIDSIMDRRARELRVVRSKVQPQLDSIIMRTRRQLDSVLTPEQRKKAEEIRRKHPRPPGPPQGDFGPGPAGPPSGPPPR